MWEIVIHCTATPEGRDVSVETIRGWHRKNGWSDIGYHYVVALDGTIQPGRPEAVIGAHVSGHNAGMIGISYVGGCDAKMQPKDTRTPAQRDALMAACRALIAKYPTIAKVSGHRDYDAGKACPSFDVRKDPLSDLPKEARP
ncbi:lysozyme [Amaricoccus sp. HAR-UPW-R2A-40]|nr:lysozyme [Amaricoccus sp. HAR-UPW-R2A-40]